VDKSGSWYSYNGDRIGQGKDNVRGFLKENPEIAQEIEGRIRDAVFPKPEEGETAEESEPVEAQA
jgi:recombination protein RecA